MKIYIDNLPFDVKAAFYPTHDELPPTPTASGSHLAAAAGRDASYQLYLEVDGGAPDVFVQALAPCILKDGMRFYTVPASIIGA